MGMEAQKKSYNISKNMKKWDKNHFLTKTFGYIRKKHYLCSRKHLKKYHYFQGFYGGFTTKTNKQEEIKERPRGPGEMDFGGMKLKGNHDLL